MKTIRSIVIICVLMVVASSSLTSCATQMKVNNEESVAGYTLKNKKELMQQKITNRKSKTVLTTP
ncbi:hypothetical protein [Aureisphaera sp.]